MQIVSSPGLQGSSMRAVAGNSNRWHVGGTLHHRSGDTNPLLAPPNPAILFLPKGPEEFCTSPKSSPIDLT
jgi:hypothetical protein